MIDILVNALDAYIKLCKDEKDKTAKRMICERAFGACQYHVMMFPSDQRTAEYLWVIYKPQFENILGE